MQSEHNSDVKTIELQRYKEWALFLKEKLRK